MAVIGIDLGGTKIISAIFDKEGNILCKTSHLLEKRTGSEVGRLVLQTIDELITMSGKMINDIEAFGICVPGIADCKTGLVWAPNIEGWENYPLQKEIEEYINNDKIKISVASDRTCYILGETWKGAAKNAKNAVFIAVGTGIGMGLLIDGRIVHGHGDAVGSAGWFALETPYFDEYERYGCLESYASGDGIARQTKKLLKEGLLFREST
jgi:glucokinase